MKTTIAMKYWVRGRVLKLSIGSAIRLLLLPNDRKASLMRSMLSAIGSETPFVGATFYPLYQTVYYPETKEVPNASN